MSGLTAACHAIPKMPSLSVRLPLGSSSDTAPRRRKSKIQAQILFRLESTSTDCSQQLTSNSNRTMFRLDRLRHPRSPLNPLGLPATATPRYEIAQAKIAAIPEGDAIITAGECMATTRILVVDADAANCKLVEDVLASAGLTSLILNDTTQAAVRASSEKFAAVFVDVRMPPPDGIELTRQIRAGGMNHRTPIVIITGEEDHGILTRAFEAGANFFLFKPIDRHRLLRLIRVTAASIESEARRFQRVKTACVVSLDSGREKLAGTTLDVSLNGMFVQCNSTLPVGTSLQAKLALRTGMPPVLLPARIVRVSYENRMGLQFENPAADDARRLQEFLLPLILSKAE